MGPKDPLHAAVSTRIRRLLQLTGHNQKALAPVLDGDPSIITNRLNGRANITVDDLGKIAKFLDVSPTVFLMDDDEFTAWVIKEHPEWIAGVAQVESTSTWMLLHSSKARRHHRPKTMREMTGDASSGGMVLDIAAAMVAPIQQKAAA